MNQHFDCPSCRSRVTRIFLADGSTSNLHNVHIHYADDGTVIIDNIIDIDDEHNDDNDVVIEHNDDNVFEHFENNNVFEHFENNNVFEHNDVFSDDDVIHFFASINIDLNIID
jgi:hypothetical protein